VPEGGQEAGGPVNSMQTPFSRVLAPPGVPGTTGTPVEPDQDAARIVVI